MKTAYNPIGPAAKPRGPWQRFWFQPTDPTTLGFMRIIAGLIVIYVHLAYSFDLQAFFGAHGFWDLKTANQQRTESPYSVQKWNWGPPETAIMTPDLPDQRVAVFDFLKHLPEDKNERDSVLQYLYFLIDKYGWHGDKDSETVFYSGLMLSQRVLETTSDLVDKTGKALADEPVDTKNIFVTRPDFLINALPDERVRIWNDLRRFANYLPKPEFYDGQSRRADLNLTYVNNWLERMPPEQRKKLVDFLRKLPGGAEGTKIIEYMEMWHQDPRLAFTQGRPVFSLWYHVTDPTAMAVFHVVFIGIFVMFTIGFRTRTTSFLTWIATLFYIHRTQQVLFGMDAMMNIALFYLMIGPSGAALSVDRLIERYRASRALFKAGGKSVPWAEAVLAGPQPSSLANFAVRLLQIHFCFIYLASGLSKLKGGAWWSQDAAWFTIANPEFCPLQYPQYEWLLLQLASFRTLLAIAYAGIVYFTLFMEIGLPFLIWTRMRPVMIIGAVFLHTGIAWMMGLTCFGLLMMTLLLCYVPASVVRERLCWPPGSGAKLTLRFSRRNSRHGRLVGLLRRLDLTGQIAPVDESSKKATDEMPAELVEADGTTHTGYAIVQRAMRVLVFPQNLVWLLWVPGVGLLLRWFTNEHSQTIDRVEPAPAAGVKTPAGR